MTRSWLHSTSTTFTTSTTSTGTPSIDVQHPWLSSRHPCCHMDRMANAVSPPARDPSQPLIRGQRAHISTVPHPALSPLSVSPPALLFPMINPLPLVSPFPVSTNATPATLLLLTHPHLLAVSALPFPPSQDLVLQQVALQQAQHLAPHPTADSRPPVHPRPHPPTSVRPLLVAIPPLSHP